MKRLSHILYFTLLVTLSSLIPTLTEAFQPTRNVSVPLGDLKGGSINVYFVCPNVRSNADSIKYFKVSDRSKTFQISDEVFGVILKIKAKSDLGEYGCRVESQDKTTRNATLNVFDTKEIDSPSKYMYDVAKTKYVVAKSGSVELDCADAGDQKVTWYKPAQFYIHSGKTLKLENVDTFSYGTYYCAIGETNKPTISVKKVIVVPEEPKEKERSIDLDVSYVENVIPKSFDVMYNPNVAKSNLDTVTWEQPPGTIILEFARNLYVQTLSKDKTVPQYYYRMNTNGDPTVNNVGKIFLAKMEDGPLSFKGNIGYGEDGKISCDESLDFPNTTKVIWKKNNKIIFEGNTIMIKNIEKEVFGNYSCEIHDSSEVRVKNINMAPQKPLKDQIEMTPDPGLYFSFHQGASIELHCEINKEDHKPKLRSREIIWTFNGKIMNKKDTKRYAIVNTLKMSALQLNKVDMSHQGTYKCFKRSMVLAVNLLIERSEITLISNPPEDTLADNVNDEAEFHCKIISNGYNASSIKWSFIPENSNTEEPLPKEAIVKVQKDLEKTSFVSIDNVLKRHDGYFVCRVQDKVVKSRLIVKGRPVLTVTPKEITTKPGGSARFQCEVTEKNGEVIWRRRDKKSFAENKESAIPMKERSLLQVNQATKAYDGTVYECVFKDLVEYVTLYVKDECQINQRKCKNETCIDESKFCDGKNDCGDNSDEDPIRCNQCSPNSILCEVVNKTIPTKRCIIKHWQCDGTDDCGNNFDEINCPVVNRDKCIGTHYQCDNNTLIPRAYWCDGEPDCKSMEDEEGCRAPAVIEPMKPSQIKVIENATLSLECIVSGKPIPTITWRFNWDNLSANGDYNLTNVISNCSIITSTLKINRISPELAGIYTCEAIAKQRVIAPDITVEVSKGSVCKRPYYNNDAFLQDYCLRCYCSNVTDDCTSASGYITNPNLKESLVKSSDAAIMHFKTGEYFEDARTVSFANETLKMYVINKENYKKLVPSNDYFFGGSFNMRGSWLNRYGYPLTYKLILFGESTGHITGPIVALKGVNQKQIYYCTPKSRLAVYASDDNSESNMRIILWEKDNWFSDSNCKVSATRSEFMEILKDVVTILFRIKYFEKQTNFKMSKITMQEAIKSKVEHSWVSRVEKCNCPLGYSGMSCEIQQRQL